MDGFQRRKEEKMNNILEAALQLFMEFGIQKVSISQIAKKANVSQVTIYNYFDSKHNLIREVFIYYTDNVTLEFEKLINSELPFPDKIKQIIFNKKKAANQLHEELYEYFLKEYREEGNHLQKLYAEKVLPQIMSFFEDGKKEGFINKNLSNEAILFYFQMMTDYFKKEETYQQLLPLTEDIMQILFYGILGKDPSTN
ncbi:TetR/AcrR family transcriptional regulator [Sutcliffiella cohnii]|uniref:TetR family transcriptional regulator n=1 Tax=Sutcliffiella cohnii TaxID=33932 RepID=A0A223KQM6_9BACI|nr:MULTISPECIES: TetR/AcrR family transcriptional regulator [Sutcliffiella]AST91654.1 TetR family transcriptional regulator [Sutcliffiella cohnii]MED4014758.1 TetR/AcrR family transcriptional regulator [Sutcliffiella cohnii]WBL12873.1 TetR/AcrR family transcriptional regulator [Sutcliffiella sp. NC1]